MKFYIEKYDSEGSLRSAAELSTMSREGAKAQARETSRHHVGTWMVRHIRGRNSEFGRVIAIFCDGQAVKPTKRWHR